jgi:hypothetical protein
VAQGERRSSHILLAVAWCNHPDNSVVMAFVLNTMVKAACFQVVTNAQLNTAKYGTSAVWLERWNTYCSGINSAVESFKQERATVGVVIHKVHDCFHLSANAKTAVKKCGVSVNAAASDAIKNAVSTCARAQTLASFERKKAEFSSAAYIEKHGLWAKLAIQYVQIQHADTEWLLAAAPVSRVSLISSTSSEATISALLPHRGRGPLHGLLGIVEWGSLRFANLCAAVAKDIASRPEASITFGLANALYKADAEKVGNYTAMQSGALFNVSSANRASGLGTYVVDVTAGTCSCGKPLTTGLICVHARAAIAKKHSATSATQRQATDQSNFFAIGLRRAHAVRAYAASERAVAAPSPWRDIPVTVQAAAIVAPVPTQKRKERETRNVAGADADRGDESGSDGESDAVVVDVASTADAQPQPRRRRVSTGGKRGPSASGRFMGAADFND